MRLRPQKPRHLYASPLVVVAVALQALVHFPYFQIDRVSTDAQTAGFATRVVTVLLVLVL